MKKLHETKTYPMTFAEYLEIQREVEWLESIGTPIWPGGLEYLKGLRVKLIHSDVENPFEPGKK